LVGYAFARLESEQNSSLSLLTRIYMARGMVHACVEFQQPASQFMQSFVIRALIWLLEKSPLPNAITEMATHMGRSKNGALKKLFILQAIVNSPMQPHMQGQQ
jgi:hypothetical protein